MGSVCVSSFGRAAACGEGDAVCRLSVVAARATCDPMTQVVVEFIAKDSPGAGACGLWTVESRSGERRPVKTKITATNLSLIHI